MGAILLILLSILVPLYKGGKDYWPGYLFATKASGFIILAIAALTMSFIAADGDGKAVYHFAVALTLMYVVLYFFTLLLMGYIARKDDSGIRKIPKGGKGSVGIWLGWKNAEAARIGARFAIYPMLFDIILILMLIRYGTKRKRSKRKKERNLRPRVRRRQRQSSLARRNHCV